MLIADLVKEQQPEVHKKMIKAKKVKTVNEILTEKDFENMMKHSSYKRGKGGLRQVR